MVTMNISFQAFRETSIDDCKLGDLPPPYLRLSRHARAITSLPKLRSRACRHRAAASILFSALPTV